MGLIASFAGPRGRERVLRLVLNRSVEAIDATRPTQHVCGLVDAQLDRSIDTSQSTVSSRLHGLSRANHNPQGLEADFINEAGVATFGGLRGFVQEAVLMSWGCTGNRFACKLQIGPVSKLRSRENPFYGTKSANTSCQPLVANKCKLQDKLQRRERRMETTERAMDGGLTWAGSVY